MKIEDDFFCRNYFFSEYNQAHIRLRYRKLMDRFRKKYGRGATYLARAPGRINLIGEHTDYNGCPVLPMAVNRDIIAVFRRSLPKPSGQPSLTLEDAGDNRFTSRTFRIEREIAPFATGDWGNYAKAAVQGIVSYLLQNECLPSALAGADVIISGNIPYSAGMSSSSALVVLVALIFLAVNGIPIPPEELAPLLADAERYVGTQGGGMDQAICLMGRPGQALKIDFNPFAVHPVSLPAGYVFVAANSLVQASKSGGVMDEYNRRSIECRIVSAILKRKFCQYLDRELSLELIGDLTEEKLDLPGKKIRELADTFIKDEPYDLKAIADSLDLPPEKIRERYCTRQDGSAFPEPRDGFKLKMRYRHVISEWERVENSVKALESGQMDTFGSLMNASHASCRDDFEISCPELDRLTEIALKSEALGARLTGAGFGGCTVSLVHETDLPRLLEALWNQYYRRHAIADRKDLIDIAFHCKAVEGAGIISSEPAQFKYPC